MTIPPSPAVFTPDTSRTMPVMFTRDQNYTSHESHLTMVLDLPRVRAYAAAIAKVVKSGDVVLDVGAGSGILSMLAARAGAKRVWAVERTDTAELTRQTIAENGFSDQITVLQQDLVTIEDLDPKPNVIVSELLGAFALDENQHAILGVARRLATDDVIMIPRSYRLVFAPAWLGPLADDLDQLHDVVGLNMGPMRRRLASCAGYFAAHASDIAGLESATESIDPVSPVPEELKVSLTVARDGPINAVISSFTADLADGVSITTSPYEEETHWPNMSFPLEPPLSCQAGDQIEFTVRPRVPIDRHTWGWLAESVRGERGSDGLGDRHTNGDRTRLQMWAASLAGGGQQTLRQMTDSLLCAFPSRFASRLDAEHEVKSMCAASDVDLAEEEDLDSVATS